MFVGRDERRILPCSLHSLLFFLFSLNFFREALSEVDWNTLTVDLQLSPEAPHFLLITRGAVGTYKVEYPQDRDVFSAFQVPNPLQYSYKLTLLKPSMKALHQASRTKMRVNEQVCSMCP